MIITGGYLLVESWAFEVNLTIESNLEVSLYEEQSEVVQRALGGSIFVAGKSTVDRHFLGSVEKFKAYAMVMRSWKSVYTTTDDTILMLLVQAPSVEGEELWRRFGTLWNVKMETDVVKEEIPLRTVKIV